MNDGSADATLAVVILIAVMIIGLTAMYIDQAEGYSKLMVIPFYAAWAAIGSAMGAVIHLCDNYWMTKGTMKGWIIAGAIASPLLIPHFITTTVKFIFRKILGVE